ncbi:MULTISPECIES: OB-fold domain-containing protein [Rhodopseudomonas]|uniref:DNA-binding protein n=1 Tax=Rhodopseudomonas palustris TaxID=1076 RepID=A0A0D7EFX4_RHOPL|nr:MULTISPECIES: OB-fold domain-containing protein [Rhodopseudomonas]KIZ39648.1 DNA-binding protein [Rhodopseudomonas palustris]MDF3809463.1 OB-fold domain-containing protein [Rhodopseudomonas sp. BAL398]WOK18421.1 OB-fold domain-containing protein [Rhodopseudomonas sp. BAL398]
MSDANATKDWTGGAEAILYQQCKACGAKQYFRRDFCAACGGNDLALQQASGAGVVHAATLVCRAATPEAREYLPFALLLIDAAEGFRMMAHGANDLAIGDRVTARFARFTGRLVPYFERTTS